MKPKNAHGESQAADLAMRFEAARARLMRLSQKQAEALYVPLLSSSTLRRLLDSRLPSDSCVGTAIKEKVIRLTSVSNFSFYDRIAQTIEQNNHDTDTLSQLAGTYAVFRFNASRRYVHTATRIVAEESGAFRFDQWESDDLSKRPLNSGLAFVASRWLFMVGFRVGSMRLMIARVPDHKGDTMHGIVLSQPQTVANPFASRALLVPIEHSAEIDRFRPRKAPDSDADPGMQAFMSVFAGRPSMSFALDD